MTPRTNTPRLSNSYAGVPAGATRELRVEDQVLRLLGITDAGGQ